MRFLLILALLALPAYAKKPPKQPPPVPVPQCTAAGWCDQGLVSGVTSNYTPVVIIGNQIRVYANTNGIVDGNLYLRSGTWGGVGGAQMVLDIPSPRDTYVRTVGIDRGASGTYYAVTFTGDGYPTQGGYSPSLAVSADGVTWSWKGPILLFGRNQSSAAALIVDEPILRAWIDLAGLYEMWSNDNGATWQTNSLNVWPIPNETPQFVTAAKDGQGHIHLMGANAYPATAIRHVVLCRGQYPAKVVTLDAGIRDQTIGKGANLAYDPTTNILHALVSGRHWQQNANQSYGC